MKRLMIIAVTAALIFGNSNAQDMGAAAPILLNYNTLEKKVERCDGHINHERKGAKERTWIKRGNLFQDVDNFGLEQLQLGIDKTTMKIFYGEPESTEKEDDTEILKYEHMKYYFENGKLSGWKRIDPIHESPLDEALRSYKKAVELTDEGKKMKTQEKIRTDLEELKNQFLRAGQNDYYHKDYLSALDDFESILRVNDFPVFEGVIDTLMINYSGIVAREIAARYMNEGETDKGVEMYKRTLDYYDQLSDLGYGGSSNYVQMTRDYYAIGDTVGAIENLKKGLEQYPDSSLLVTFAAQAYYLMKENEEGLEFLNNRLEKKPECATAYYWKGLLITNEDDLEEEVIQQALDYYDTSLMYDPGNGNVLYQSGYVNYAVGANYYEQESYEEDPDVRKVLSEKGKEYYMAAVDKLEKTYEISEGDYTLRKESLDLLKRIYYKLYGSEDEHYIRTNERLKSL
jgi:tetratricopeptide (TPR) repeat protein